MDIAGSITSHLYATHTVKMKDFCISLADFRDEKKLNFSSTSDIFSECLVGLNRTPE